MMARSGTRSLEKVIWTALGLGLAIGVASWIVPDYAGSEEAKPAVAQGKSAEGKPAEPAATDQKSAPAQPVSHSARSGCLVDETALSDLNKRLAEVEAQKKDLAARETEMQAKERAIQEELKKLAEVRKEISLLKVGLKTENEERVSKLVETFETMSPKAAAAVMSTLDEGLAISAMSRMSTPKLAKVMNLLDQEKSARLSEALVGIARSREPASAKANAGKGGEGASQNGANAAGAPAGGKP